MAGGAINIGGIYADLDVSSGNMEAGLAKGEQALRKIEMELKNLDAQLKAGTIGLHEHAARVAELGAVANDLAVRMKAANAALMGNVSAIDLLNAKMQQGASGAGRMGMALMQLGYITDDLQYGFSSIVNNIGPLILNLSGNAGLAAAAQMAAVAANLLYQRWDEVKEAFGDTSGQQKAMQSLEGMIGLLKRLQADADSFSWGDQLAIAFGLNPDAGKGLKAAGLKVAVEAKERAEKNAKALDSGESEEVAKEKGRFKEAIVEAGGGKSDAMENVTKRVAGKLMAESNVQSFLSPIPKDTVASNLAAGAAPELKGPSDREEYQILEARQLVGEKLTHDELTRKADLEQRARDAAEKQAREQIGAASGDIKAAGRIGDLIGGDAGDVIAGRKETKKDTKKADQESEKEGEKSRALRKTQVRDIVQRAAPDLKHQADKLAERVGSGEITQAEAVDALKGKIDTIELSPDEQRKAAEEALQDTDKDTHDERMRRLRHEATRKAREVMPDVAHRADRLADEAHRGVRPEAGPAEVDPFAAEGITPVGMGMGMGGEPGRPPAVRPAGPRPEGAVDALRREMMARGLDEDEAKIAAEEEMRRTEKEDPLKRSARLRRESVAKAKEVVPDLEDKVEAEVAKGLFSPTGDTAGRGKLKDLLLKGGMDKDEADSAVKDLFRKGTEDVRQRLATVAGPRKDDQASRSEVYRTSDLTDRIQSAIGNDDEAKKTNSWLEKQYAVLQKIANKADGGDGWEVT